MNFRARADRFFFSPAYRREEQWVTRDASAARLLSGMGVTAGAVCGLPFRVPTQVVEE